MASHEGIGEFDSDTFPEFSGDEDDDFEAELDAAKEAFQKYLKDVIETPGRVTIKKVLVILSKLATLIGVQQKTIQFLLQKDQLFTECVMNINNTLSKHDYKLKMAENNVTSVSTNEDKLTSQQNGLLKTDSMMDRVTPNAPQIKKNVCTDQDFIPKTLLLDHFDNLNYEKSNVTFYGIPIQELENMTAKSKGDAKEAIDKIGRRIVENRMKSQRIKVNSFSRIKNTKFDKSDTFRILIRFQSPTEAARFMEQCKADGVRTMRLGLTRLERCYAKNATDELNRKNATLDQNSGDVYIRRGLFRIVKIKKNSNHNI